ncbi:hypothetical protein ACIGO8_06865 [Streptomyces sp. NPDC053493]|uniref:hypothetical protein n=1 Tax=Streptomyces sp. NPDC053493 TaxID=3365705 RepID=UPI0037CEC63A
MTPDLFDNEHSHQATPPLPPVPPRPPEPNAASATPAAPDAPPLAPAAPAPPPAAAARAISPDARETPDAREDPAAAPVAPVAAEAPETTDAPVAAKAPATAVAPEAAETPEVSDAPDAAAAARAAEEPAAAAAAEATDAPENPGNPEDPEDLERPQREEDGDEAIRTLLWTAATERPVTEVAALVARLKESGELSSPADVALRAAAVSRPLDEVRQLVVLLNESGYDLHQAETTLRAAAVGRPIEDIVELVNIIGADASSWRAPAGTGDAEPARAAAAAPADPKTTSRVAGTSKRVRGALKSAKSPLDHALAAGPGSHTPSPALRSVLRWPAAAALFACGLIHLPTDVDGLRSGGSAAMVSVVVTVFCLLAAIWLAVRDSVTAWTAAAAVAVGLIGLHVMAGARTVDVLTSSLGSRFAWAQALAVLSSAAVVALAAAAVLRHTRTTGATGST